MAVRFDADGEDYTRALTLGTQAALTVTCWLKISVNRATWSTPWSIDNGTGDNWLIQTGADGVTLGTVFDATSQQNMGALTVGTWYFVVLAMNGSNGFLYHKTAAATGLSTVTVDGGTASVNAATLRIGESPWGGEWWNGCIAAVKVWTAQLSAAEVANEATQYQPRRVANLAAYYPLVRPETTDYSGNARTLSGGAGATREDGPPIQWWPAAPRLIHTVAAGPATVTGVADASLGALTATASATVTHHATAAAPLGSLAAAAAGFRTEPGTAAAPLGSLTATASGTRTTTGTAAAPLGALTASAAGATAVSATASAPLGGLSAAASGTVTPVGAGTATASLGTLTATATGLRSTTGTATAQLGPLTASTAGGVTVQASAAAIFGALAAAATGTVTAPGGGTANAPLGTLVATATGEHTAVGTAAATLGALIAAGTGTRTTTAAAAAVLGGLVAAATGARFTTGTAVALLGALAAAGTVPPPITYGSMGTHQRPGPTFTTTGRQPPTLTAHARLGPTMTEVT